MKKIILGAGFTGMAAGIKIKAPIYEATQKAGGICNSYVKEGFEFFNGGPHLLFGKGVGLDYIKSIVPVNEYVKKAGVYYNKMFRYPIQNQAQQKTEFKPGTFKAWNHENFSLQECNLFLDPFNEKYTAGLYNDIIQYDAYKTPAAGTQGFVSTFCDPVNGLSDLVDNMAKQNTIHYGRRVTRIDHIERFVVFQDGKTEDYDRLISTIPLNFLLHMCGVPIEEIDLPFTSVLVLNIGAEKAINTPDDHWVYVPFCKSNFHRIGFYSNIDPNKAPEGKVNLSVEMAFRDIQFDDLDTDFIMMKVVEELQSWGFIGNVITSDPTWVACGYTWLRSREHRDNHLKWLKAHEIISTGRYGKWHFQGLVDSIKDGFEVTP